MEVYLPSPFVWVNEHPSGRTLHVGLQFIVTMAREAGHTELTLTTGDVILVQQTPTQIIMQAERRVLGLVTK